MAAAGGASGAPFNPIIEGEYPAPARRPQDNTLHNYANDSKLQHHPAGEDIRDYHDYNYQAENQMQSNEMPLEVNAVVNNEE